jgi:hypothetical protein
MSHLFVGMAFLLERPQREVHVVSHLEAKGPPLTQQSAGKLEHLARAVLADGHEVLVDGGRGANKVLEDLIAVVALLDVDKSLEGGL